jgi:hypothetical protein
MRKLQLLFTAHDLSGVFLRYLPGKKLYWIPGRSGAFPWHHSAKVAGICYRF